MPFSGHHKDGASNLDRLPETTSASHLICILHNADMFDGVITSDETWRFQHDTETKRQNIQWKTQFTSAEKTLMCPSQFKTILMCFFDHKMIVHYEFIAQGQTVNQQYYLETLTRLRESIRRKRPEL
jgi:hypothetical protein